MASLWKSAGGNVLRRKDGVDYKLPCLTKKELCELFEVWGTEDLEHLKSILPTMPTESASQIWVYFQSELNTIGYGIRCIRNINRRAQVLRTAILKSNPNATEEEIDADIETLSYVFSEAELDDFATEIIISKKSLPPEPLKAPEVEADTEPDTKKK